MSTALRQFFRELTDCESSSECGARRTISIVSDNARTNTTVLVSRFARDLRRWKSASSANPLRKTSRWDSSPSNFDSSPLDGSLTSRPAARQNRVDNIPGKPILSRRNSDSPLSKHCSGKKLIDTKIRRDYIADASLPKSLRSLPY